MTAPARSRIMPSALGKDAPFRYWLMLFAVMLLAVLLWALTTGKYPVTPADIFRIVTAGLTGKESGAGATAETVVWNVRIPRVLGGLLVGAALAAAGAVYQGLFRNPLVSPDILGVSAGASLGAVLGIFLSSSAAVIQVLAFAGGILAVSIVYGIGSAVRDRDPTLILVLAGVAVAALLGACVSLLKVLADPYNQLPAITFWLLGSLANVTRVDMLSIVPATVVGLIPLVLLRWRMNVMTLDDEEARALGLETRRLRLLFIAAATLMTAAAVSISGVVGWIGLLVPHVARMLVGPDFSRLLPSALMLGGGYLVAVDTLARSIANIEVPLGILTAALGAPFFLWLLLAARVSWR